MGLLGMVRWGFGAFESYSCFLFFFQGFLGCSSMFIEIQANSEFEWLQRLTLNLESNIFNGSILGTR